MIHFHTGLSRSAAGLRSFFDISELRQATVNNPRVFPLSVLDVSTECFSLLFRWRAHMIPASG